MDFKEAIDYMRKTGNSVFVKNPKYVSDFEYKLGTWDTRGYTCLKHNRFYQNGKRVWRDVEMSAVDILEEMLSCTYEPVIEYVSFVDAVKQIKENNTLKFIRKNDVDNGIDAYLFFVDDAYEIEIQDIGKYYCEYGVILCPSIEDILATDWYVMRGST